MVYGTNPLSAILTACLPFNLKVKSPESSGVGPSPISDPRRDKIYKKSSLKHTALYKQLPLVCLFMPYLVVDCFLDFVD